MEHRSYWKERYIRIYLSMIVFTVFVSLLSPFFVIGIFIFTDYWYLALLYVIWIYLDRHTSETGSRGIWWVRKYFPSSQYPLSFKLSSSYTLDPHKNYLFCCFPHGIISYSFLILFSSDAGGFRKIFPTHKYYGATTHSSFFLPLYREILFIFNAVSVSERSLNYLLNDASTGKVIGLSVGGKPEIWLTQEGDYHIYLKKRKGFIRVALKNGSPLVPVFSFGLNSIYKYPNNSFARILQHLIERVIKSKIVFFYGQGIFQDWFGLVPFIKNITTVAGEPIDVQKNENPTTEDIEELHEKFTDGVIKLFNEHKHKYLPNAKEINLVIH